MVGFCPTTNSFTVRNFSRTGTVFDNITSALTNCSAPTSPRPSAGFNTRSHANIPMARLKWFVSQNNHDNTLAHPRDR
jgi:hypothetical protein